METKINTYVNTYATFVKENEISGDNKHIEARNSAIASSHLYCALIGLNQIAIQNNFVLVYSPNCSSLYVAGIQNLNRNSQRTSRAQCLRFIHLQRTANVEFAVYIYIYIYIVLSDELTSETIFDSYSGLSHCCFFSYHTMFFIHYYNS